MNCEEHRSKSADALRWIGAIGIATIAVMRCFIVFAPQLVFDTDPATDPVPLGGLAMAGSLWLDVALLVCCAIGIMGESLSGRGIEWKLVVLAMVPVPVLLWHGNQDLAHLWRGSTWASAMIAAVTLLHLARDRTLRIVFASLVLAVIAALLVRGIAQVSFEHADMVRTFEEHRDQFLADRGWAPDSAAAKIFERRLRQPQPTGWFPSTNILGSLAAFGLIAWSGLTVVAVRSRLQSGWSGAMGLLAAACAAALWFTGSKGAIGTALVGLFVAIAPLMMPRVRPLLERFGGAMCVGLVLLTLAAIVVRGTALPESFGGDKSLLFRWHYLVASTDMFMDKPLTGVGPDGFQDAYTQFRVPRNPEEVQSAHSMFADWLSTLGIAGAAWITIILVLVWRAGAAMRSSYGELPANRAYAIMRCTALGAAVVIVLGLAPAVMVEWPVIDNMSLMVRGLGVLAFVCAAAISAFVMAKADGWILNWLLTAAALAVVIHGQIEMTFHYGGSVVWAMCALGVAASGGKHDRVSNRATGLTSAMIVLLVAVWIGVFGSALVSATEGFLNSDARKLIAAGGNPAELCQVRQRVAASLKLSSEQLGQCDYRLALAATQQFELAAEECDHSQRATMHEQAIDTLERAMPRFGRQSVIAAAANAHAKLAALANNQTHWDRAIELASDITRRDPHGIASWRNLGDINWAAGRQMDAAIAYERALQNNSNFELDELKQLSEREQQRIQRRITDARASGG